MNPKQRGLGRGLEALLGELDAGPETSSSQEGLEQLPVTQIEPSPYQPRRHFDDEALQQLAASLRSQGLLQPIIVRPLDGHRYELIAGERRWRAAKLAELKKIPALIRHVSDGDAAAISLIENLQRRDLNMLEQAQALHRLIAEFGLTHAQLAHSIGHSRSAITNTLRLLKLTPEVQELLRTGQLDPGHARALLNQPEQQQQELAQRIVAQQLSVRDAERLTRPATPPRKDAPNKQPPISPIAGLQQRLSSRLGLPVQITHKRNGKGFLRIDYQRLEQCEHLLQKISLSDDT